VGTPLCVTVDFDTLDDDAVTIRQRDSMAQTRVPVAGLIDALRSEIVAMSPVWRAPQPSPFEA
jgi:glycyl-tRNA synthetase